MGRIAGAGIEGRMFFAVLFLTVCTAQTYTMRVWTTSSSSTRVCSNAALNQVFTAGVCGSVTSGSTFSFVFTDLNATHVRAERFAGSSCTGVTADRNCDVPVNVCYEIPRRSGLLPALCVRLH